jgi:uncharacterized protein (DUF1684 family)
MKRNISYVFCLLILGTGLIQCTSKQQNSEQYKQSIKHWRKERLKNLKAEDGWLNLAGLFWLDKGKNSIGSAESNDIEFPEKAPEKLGTIDVSNDMIKFEAAKDVKVTHKEKPINSLDLKTDQEENPTVLQHGSLKWFIIDRNGELAIRLRDLESPLLDKLDSIPAFSVKQGWKIKAEFKPFKEKKTIEVPNVLGNTYEENVPGILKFTLDGKEYELYPLGSRESMFVIFGDETNAEETYGGGRFLSVEGPNEKNITYIDFNKAYNPPCAFTPYATCPLPPKENILPVKINAGEKAPGLEVPHH